MTGRGLVEALYGQLRVRVFLAAMGSWFSGT